jgi:cell division protein ZipA
MLDLPPRTPPDSERDYLPDPAVAWIVDVRFDGDPSLDPQTIEDAFDTSWTEQFDDFISYGRDVRNGRWTFLIAADGPKAVDQVKLAFDYVDILDPDAPLATQLKYEQRLQQVAERLSQFGKPTVTGSVPPAEAAARSMLLREIKNELNASAVLVLKATEGQKFEGRKVWDAMLCLGLEWGDMDCFHWQNGSDEGGDSHFSVETTTPPGYFLPEEVAADRVNVDDLVFVFSIPRSARPVEVFDAMARAVEYCKSRLGGSIVDEAGRPADVQRIRQQIAETTERLRNSGFVPGSNSTLQLF